MSILASPSACLFNLKPHASINSQSAFKKPSMPKKPAQASQESYSQPIKKIKNDCSKPVSVYPKQQEIKTKPNRLTIEDVFDTPLQSKTNCKDLFADEFADEGSSLSFISSCTSLDSLEEVTAIEPNKFSDKVMVCESVQESLFIKDDIMNQLNNLLSSQMLNSNQFCTFQPAEFLQTLQWEEQDLLRNATQPLTYIDPINISFMKLNEYVGQEADNNEFCSDFNLFVKKGLEVKKNKSDIEDGDYFDRESTAYDAADSSDKSKGGSPTYGGFFDMSEEERSSDKVIKILKKQEKTAKKAKKEKLVRPQVEKVKKIRVNKSATQDMMQQNIKELCVSEDSQAVLPMLSFDSEREQRVVVKSVWDPETMNTQEMEVYFEQLSQVIESAVTDQEAAIKLLKDFGMNISLVLEIVNQNKALYKEMFRVKVKRLRRNGAI